MPTVVTAGVPIKKSADACAHPSCNEVVNFYQHDKLPVGWATILFERVSNSKGRSKEKLLVCPNHTLAFADRQTSLPLRVKLMRVIIESPFAGDVAKNLKYVRRAMHDCLTRKEAPYASHALYTQEGVLDDTKPDERRLGIEAGLTWGESAEKVVVYKDLGVTEGMKLGIARHKENGLPIEERHLPDWDKEE